MRTRQAICALVGLMNRARERGLHDAKEGLPRLRWWYRTLHAKAEHTKYSSRQKGVGASLASLPSSTLHMNSTVWCLISGVRELSQTPLISASRRPPRRRSCRGPPPSSTAPCPAASAGASHPPSPSSPAPSRSWATAAPRSSLLGVAT